MVYSPNTSVTPSASGSGYSLIFIDLQHYFLNKVSNTPEQREFFEGITEKCLTVEKTLQPDIPSVHVFSDINSQRYYYPMLANCKQPAYRQAYEQARHKVFYDPYNFTVHDDRNDVKSSLVNTTFTEALYPLHDKKVVFKTSHSGFSNSGDDCLDKVLHQQQANHCVLVGAFTDNCVWTTAMDALAHGYGVTVLTDCTASTGSSFDREKMIQENTALFSNVKNIRCLTSNEFIAERQAQINPVKNQLNY